MNDNYIMLNGRRIDLTDEQVLQLTERPIHCNAFERVLRGKSYYCTNRYGDVGVLTETEDMSDNRVFDAANYFNDKQFANQVALHQLLYRKLLKFAYDNGFEDTAEWDCHNRHYHIIYSFNDKDFDFDGNDTFKRQGTVYFSSEEGALQAISGVVIPFMKEHPEFVW